MKTKLLFIVGLFFLFSGLSAQTKTGTLKVFSDVPGVTVYLDEAKQDNFQEIKGIPVGTHYVKAISSSGEKLYGNIVNINENSVTTVLIEATKENQANQVKTDQKPAEVKPLNQVQGAGKTGTLNIFSELTNISVYLDENKQGDDIRTIQGIPSGSHYLKVMKDGVSVFGEVIAINDGQTTTILVKNDGQVAEKIMESKVKEREEYNTKKIDILFSTNSVSKTAGSSTLFPGYYGYWGYSNSVTSTSQIADFKIIKGGVEEIPDNTLANLVDNRNILNLYAADNVRYDKTVKTGTIMSIVGIVPMLVFTVDLVVKKPFLHDAPTDPNASSFSTVPAWEWTGYILSALTAWIGIKVSESDRSKFIQHHYYRVDEAAKDAKTYNKKLKEKLGLPESYDIDK
jgi:hypothetical protein